MAQDEQEAAEITTFCQGTLLNTGVPDEGKIRACILAGKRANQLGHPVILDPVGVGGSSFRQRELKKLLEQVHPSIVRCNQEEAAVLCSFHSAKETHFSRGGVESSLHMDSQNLESLAMKAARLYRCTFFITGETDIVSDGTQTPSSKRRRFQTLQDHRRRMYAFCTLCPVLLQWCFCFLKPLPQPVRSGRRFRKKPVHVSIRTAAASDSSMRCSWMW